MDDADLERKFKHDARVKWEQKYQQRHDPSEIIDACWQAALQFRSALLAKPVATDDAVLRFLVSRGWDADTSKGSGAFADVLAALSHFAPPRQRMMIEGMTIAEIERAMKEERNRPPAPISWDHNDAARVAHRLATTPAREVDPDEGAKRIAACFASATELGAQITPWDDMSEALRNGWRAVAAGLKVVRDV